MIVFSGKSTSLQVSLTRSTKRPPLKYPASTKPGQPSATSSNRWICSGLNTSFFALLVRIGRTAATGLRSINPSSNAILKARFRILIVWFTVLGARPPESQRSLNAMKAAIRCWYTLWESVAQSGPDNPLAFALGSLLAALLLGRVINGYKLPQMDMLVELLICRLYC